MARFGANDVVVRRRPRRWPFVVAGLGIPVLCAALDQEGLAAAIGFVEALLFFMLPALAIENRPSGEKRVPVLHADGQGVSIGKTIVLRRDAISASLIEPLADGQFAVQLWGMRARDDLTVVLGSQERATQLLEALGVDRQAACYSVESAPLRTLARKQAFRLVQLAGTAAIFALVCAVAWRHELFGLTLVPFIFLYFAILRFLRFRRRIMLGDDALVIDAPVAIGEIASIGHDDEKNALVTRRDGSAISLNFESAEKRNAFASRLQKAMAHCGSANVAHVAELVAPATRTRESWLEDLRKLRTATFRGATVATEGLWRIVEHPGADAGARAGAVAALVPQLDDEARVRIGALAGSTAHADLRAAFEAATAEDATDEQVVAAYLK